MGKRDPKEVMKMAGFSARIVNQPGSRASIAVIDKAMYQARLSKLKDGELAMVYIITGNEKKLRTDQQNRAMHLYFERVAEALNEGGYTVHVVLKQKVDIDWNMYAVKELLWRPAQQAILQKSSTTDLRKQEDIDKVYNHLNRHLGEKFGIHVEFPSYEPGYADTAPLKTDRKPHDKKQQSGGNAGGKKGAGDGGNDRNGDREAVAPSARAPKRAAKAKSGSRAPRKRNAAAASDDQNGAGSGSDAGGGLAE